MTQYITKTNLSLGPQFGSQMTQYAGLYAVSKKLEAEIVFTEQQMSLFRGVKLFDAFNLPNKIIDGTTLKFSNFLLNDVVVDDRVFTLDKSVNWDIGGWFHTFNCFHEYESDLKNIFTFKSEIYNEAKSKINLIKNEEPYPLISLHVRRGDYVELASLKLTLSYYEEALQLFFQLFNYEYFKLIVFSDDIAWCKENINGENVYYSENNSNYVDMCMMSLCNHNIIANSSFSWWGAYLNSSPNKVVVCPKDYVGYTDTTHQFINNNYYPETWNSMVVQ